MSIHQSGPTIDLDYVADIACPWCYIGLERLKKAIALRPSVAIAFRWRPFMLNPDLPSSGIERAEYLFAKFGPSATRIYQKIEAIGRQEGVPFAFNRIKRQPNTTDAHRLILHAQERGRVLTMIDRLFRAFYLEGEDLGSQSRLALLAEQAGFDPAEIRALLEGEDLVSEVIRSQRTTTWQGIRGVPVFILGKAHALSGAQPPEVLVQLLDFARTPAPVNP